MHRKTDSIQYIFFVFFSFASMFRFRTNDRTVKLANSGRGHCIHHIDLLRRCDITRVTFTFYTRLFYKCMLNQAERITKRRATREREKKKRRNNYIKLSVIPRLFTAFLSSKIENLHTRSLVQRPATSHSDSETSQHSAPSPQSQPFTHTHTHIENAKCVLGQCAPADGFQSAHNASRFEICLN